MSSFAVLRVPAYRRLLLALVVSQTSLYVFETVLLWTILEETGSAALIGILYAGFTLPMVLVVVPVGAVTDRAGPRGLMVASALVAASGVALAGVLAAAGALSPAAALVLAIGEGIFFGFWTVPAQVLAVQIVARRQATSAITLTSLQTGLGPLLGGALGALGLGFAGPGLTFGIAVPGLLLAAVAIAGLPRVPGIETDPWPDPPVGFAGILRVVLTAPAVVALLALSAASAGFVMSRYALFPILARDSLDAGPAGLGLLVSASGVGSLAGTVLTERLARWLRRGPATLAGLAAAGVCLGLLSIGPPLAVALAVAALVAFGLVVHQMTALTLLQLMIPSPMRGRILAIRELTRWCLIPLGSSVGGLLVAASTVSTVLFAFGALTVLAVLLVGLGYRPLLTVDVDQEGTITGTAAPGYWPSPRTRPPDRATAASSRERPEPAGRGCARRGPGTPL